MKQNKKFRLATLLLSAVMLPFLLTGYKINYNSVKVLKRGNIYYLSNTLIVKTKTSHTGALLKSQNLLSKLNNVYSGYNFTSVKQIFSNRSKSGAFGLNRIMQVNYQSGEDPYIVAAKLKKLSDVEWAEPRLLRHIFSTKVQPDDPNISLQYYLTMDHMFDAWNVSTGDTSVIIGIIDTGVDWSHPDLYGNIWHNWSDINSHWAADTDGIKFDSIGWDFGGFGSSDGAPTPDSNPIEDVPLHGTLVAGVASAVTNNGRGIAGIGYKSKIMAVKVAQKNITDPFTGEQLIVYGFEGIKYAADNGAKVINCSWGGGGFSQAEQDVINYAVSKGALVVVAAGNDNTSSYEYPAAYKNVLTAAATNNKDERSYFSNYGSYVDVCAPGNGIYGTFQPNTYVSYDGTSFSAPQVSGLAALVFAKFPNYTPLQVAQQIRVNCDNIDSVNPGFEYQLGSGRINAYKALTNTNSEAVRAVNIAATDSVQGGNGNGVFEPGETVAIKINFMNYLKTTENLNVSLQSLNPYSTVTSGNLQPGRVATLSSFDNSASVFKIALSKNIPADAVVPLIIKFSDGSYNDFQLFNINANPSYLTQSNGTISLTVTSKGNLGFNDYPANSQGDGFKYMSGNNLLFEGALMIGTDSSHIEDVARGADQSIKDTSFSIVSPFIVTKTDSGLQYGSTVFSDKNIGKDKLGIQTKLQTYTFTGSADNNFIILKYAFTNTGSSTISNFYAGIFLDWDLIDGSNDNAAYNQSNNFGYVYHNGLSTMVASALISSNDYGYWAILNDGSDGGFSIYDGFDNSEKWKTLSSGIGKSSAGPGDVSEVTSSGPYVITPGQTVTVAFVITAGDNLNLLSSSVTNARNKYGNLVTDTGDYNVTPITFNLWQNYPNPFNPSTKIKYDLPVSGFVTIKVYDILGNEVDVLVNQYLDKGKYSATFDGSHYASGIYFYRIKAGDYVSVKKMVLLK